MADKGIKIDAIKRTNNFSVHSGYVLKIQPVGPITRLFIDSVLWGKKRKGITDEFEVQGRVPSSVRVGQLVNVHPNCIEIDETRELIFCEPAEQ